MQIRLRLSLWYFFVTLAIILIVSIIAFWGMRHLLYTAMDSELDLVSDTIESSYESNSKTFRSLEEDSYNLNQHLQKIYLIVYDAAESTAYHSPLAQQISMGIPLTRTSPKVGYTIHKNPEDIPSYFFSGDNSARNKISFRAFSRQLRFQDQLVGWITIAMPIENIEDALENLFKILVAGGACATLLIAFGSYVLTKKALNPVHVITETARRISHSSLSERISVYNQADELGRLTQVLNDLFERLQQAFESQREFLADAAHELKTPLAVIRSHWEDKIGNPHLSMKLRQQVVQDIEILARLNHLINNLLLLSQTEAIETNFEFEVVELDALLREVSSDTKILAETKSQEVILVENPPLVIRGDRTRLYQLFFNLLDNAIKYTEENGKIWLHSQKRDDYAVILVRDNGPGIPAVDLPRIFNRFYRLQKDRSRKTGGSGLGLAICKLVAQAHGGSISVESQIGEGSQFFVNLPLLQT